MAEKNAEFVKAITDAGLLCQNGRKEKFPTINACAAPNDTRDKSMNNNDKLF